MNVFCRKQNQMPNAQRARFFYQSTVDALKKNIKQNLSWYRGQDNNTPAYIDDAYGEMSASASADFSCFDALNSNCADSDDPKNVVVIYDAFKFLSLQQAAEERIWAYATHRIELAKKYTAKRWNKIPSNDDKAIKYIQSHYFVSGVRGLIRDNAVARLWWMGHIASRCQDYGLGKTLDILLRDSDVRASLLERSSMSMSNIIFSGVVRLLGKSLDGRSANDKTEDKSPDIYERKNFRTLMKMLNRRGGRIMLNALNAQQLDSILNDMADMVIKDNSN